jgi:hypothetical protein
MSTSTKLGSAKSLVANHRQTETHPVFQEIVANLSTGKVRRERLDGNTYLVAHATILKQGVLNGSKGALFYPDSEIAKNYRDWDGVLLTLYHPMAANGEHLSANHPGVSDRQGIGFVKRPRLEGKLRVNAFFDETKLTQMAKSNTEARRVLNALENGEPLELSTGLFTENEKAAVGSNYRGKPYEFVARNYTPDHVAVLPGQVGACSNNDGCGILVNSSSQVQTELDLLVNGGPGSGPRPGVKFVQRKNPSFSRPETHVAKTDKGTYSITPTESGHHLTYETGRQRENWTVGQSTFKSLGVHPTVDAAKSAADSHYSSPANNSSYLLVNAKKERDMGPEDDEDEEDDDEVTDNEPETVEGMEDEEAGGGDVPTPTGNQERKRTFRGWLGELLKIANDPNYEPTNNGGPGSGPQGGGSSPKKFDEIREEHVAPIIEHLRAGRNSEAQSHMDALLKGVKAKDWEARLLAEKVKEKAGVKQQTRAERKAAAKEITGNTCGKCGGTGIVTKWFGEPPRTGATTSCGRCGGNGKSLLHNRKFARLLEATYNARWPEERKQQTQQRDFAGRYPIANQADLDAVCYLVENGGPGSGPHAGGGSAARQASENASTKTAEAGKNYGSSNYFKMMAQRAVDHANQGNHTAAAKEHTKLAADHRDSAKLYPGISLSHLAAAKAHETAATAHLAMTHNRDISQKTRDKMPESDFAGSGTSFPIKTQADVEAAAHSLGRTGQDRDKIKSRIKSIAKRKGLTLPDSMKDDEKPADNEDLNLKVDGIGLDQNKPALKNASKAAKGSFRPMGSSYLSSNTTSGKQMSHDEIRGHLQKGLDQSSTHDEPQPLIHSVYDDHCVYSKGGDLFKQGYTKSKTSDGRQVAELDKEEPEKVLKGESIYPDDVDTSAKYHGQKLTSDNPTANEKDALGHGSDKRGQEGKSSLPNRAKDASSSAEAMSGLAGSMTDRLKGAVAEARGHATNALAAAGKGEHGSAAGFHMKAAERHYALATHPDNEGTYFANANMKASDAHDAAAKLQMQMQRRGGIKKSTNNSMFRKEITMRKFTADERDLLTEQLVANCDCEDRAEEVQNELNELSDEAFGLVANSITSNVTPGGTRVGDGKKMIPASKGGGDTGSYPSSGVKGGNQDADADGDPQKGTAAAKAGLGVHTEGKSPRKTGKQVMGIEDVTTDNQLSWEEWVASPEFKSLPKIVQNTHLQSKRWWDDQKSSLINQLVSNMEGDERKQRETFYGAMEPDALQTILEDRERSTPTRNVRVHVPPVPNYVGAAGGPSAGIGGSGNRQLSTKDMDADQLLPPTVNWSKVSEENAKHFAKSKVSAS